MTVMYGKPRHEEYPVKGRVGILDRSVPYILVLENSVTYRAETIVDHYSGHPDRHAYVIVLEDGSERPLNVRFVRRIGLIDFDENGDPYFTDDARVRS